MKVKVVVKVSSGLSELWNTGGYWKIPYFNNNGTLVKEPGVSVIGYEVFQILYTPLRFSSMRQHPITSPEIKNME